MTSFRPTATQAKFAVLKKVQHGNSRFDKKVKGEKVKVISSVATEKKYIGCIKRFYDWCKANDVPLVRINSEIVELFLKSKIDHCVQKTTDGYRQSLSLVFDIEVNYIVSKKDSLLVPRAYRASHIHSLLASATQKLSLSIRLSASAGLRAVELDTIARESEVFEDNRAWGTERFEGMEAGKKYVVIGKGGLKRSVYVTDDLATELESCRLPNPIRKTQRQIHYIKRYSILGGHSFSQQFSRLSIATFGWSTGAHGLRHHYAQTRIIALQKLGYVWVDALEIVSREMGHFSTTNTLTYMR